jgi:hypothetical protein
MGLGAILMNAERPCRARREKVESGISREARATPTEIAHDFRVWAIPPKGSVI